MSDECFVEKEGGGKARFGSMEKSDLEALAMITIRKHRALMEADEEVYREWLRVSEEPTVTKAVADVLQEEYLLRQKKSEAQMQELSDMLDVLGYIPSVSKKEK